MWKAMVFAVGLAVAGVQADNRTGGAILQQASLLHYNSVGENNYRACIEAAERVRQHAIEMIPGRSWTWLLGAERSRQHLQGLRNDLNALWTNQSAFEASLTPEQQSRFTSEIQSIHDLHQHLERDVQSLDDELKKGYPTRWHVSRDLSDIQKEIRRVENLDRKIEMSRAE